MPSNEMPDKILIYVDQEISDLIPTFLDNRRRDIELIPVLLQQKDYAALQTMGHGMKGAGVGYGFDAISEIGRVLEESSKARQDEEIEKQRNKLREYLERVEIRYEGSPEG